MKKQRQRVRHVVKPLAGPRRKPTRRQQGKECYACPQIWGNSNCRCCHVWINAHRAPSGSVLRRAAELRKIAAWCDSPNLSPPVAIKIKTTSINGNTFSAGYLLRLIAECYESKV